MNPDTTSPSDCDEEIDALDARLADSSLGWKLESDIAFGPHPLQAFDAAFPSTARSPVPAVILVHGGAWMGGDKAAPHYRLFVRQFADAGFACFSTDYRLAPESRFPAPAEDIAEVANFLIEHADEFQIDPDRIAVLGSSAGGQLAALIALAGHKFGARESTDHPGPFAAAACIATPTDFRAEDSVSQPHDDPAAVALFGRPPREIPEIATVASPITHAGSLAPPFLLLHNRADPRVDSRFSSRLHEALLAAGSHSELEIFEGDSHGLSLIHQQVFRRVSAFFSEILSP